MKKREVAIIVVLLVLAVISCKVAFGVNGAQPPPKPLIDYLVQPESSVFNAYGWSEETVKLFNLIDLRARCNDQELRIKALELQVAELTKLIGKFPADLDINNPDNTVIGAISIHTNAINQFRAQIDTNTEKLKQVDPNS